MYAACISSPLRPLLQLLVTLFYFQLAFSVPHPLLPLIIIPPTPPASPHSSEFSSSSWKWDSFPQSSCLIPDPSISVSRLGRVRPNTSPHTPSPHPPTPTPNSPVSFGDSVFLFFFLLCRFPFLKAFLCWMANGALLRGGKRKKENGTYKESEKGEIEAKEGWRHLISLLIMESSESLQPLYTHHQRNWPHGSA